MADAIPEPGPTPAGWTHSPFCLREATGQCSCGGPIRGLATDEGTMIGWFANAIMRGYDDASAKLTGKLDRIRKLELLRMQILETIDAGIDRELL